jgi:ATPase subunit of ABC transporter with duplicated ATPase domains
MANLVVSNVTKSYGAKKLFEDVNVNFTAGKRYGLTGPNGAGKSTFMKILSGDLDPDTGNVSRPEKTSVLRQDQFAYEETRVLDVVMMGAKRLWATMVEKDKLLALPEIGEVEGTRLGELEVVIAEEDGYSAESDAGALLAGLGIPSSQHEGPMRELAGGLKLRVLLAQALFGKPEVLLLDEPTNNLDLDSIHWLEEFLCKYDGVLVTISHDRHFLNAICTHVADIDYNTIIVYTGAYDDMVMAKSEYRGRQEAENSDRQKKIAQLQDFVARFGAGTRASQVQSRKKQIEKLAVSDLKRSNIERPFIQLLVKKPSGKQTLTIDRLEKSWPEVRVCKDFSPLLMKGDKVAIIGGNGVGKTTLCRMLVGELQPDSGTIAWGHEASIGYIAQDHGNAIPHGKTVDEYLHSFDTRAHIQDIRGLLGKMLFKGEEGKKETKNLSGGEAVRLLFARLMLQQDNVVVLDEPTNHLDLESIVALGDALEKYQGTAIVVTHDRDLIDSFATRIWAFEEGGVIDFHGTHDDYLAQRGKKKKARG